MFLGMLGVKKGASHMEKINLEKLIRILRTLVIVVFVCNILALFLVPALPLSRVVGVPRVAFASEVCTPSKTHSSSSISRLSLALLVFDWV